MTLFFVPSLLVILSATLCRLSPPSYPLPVSLCQLSSARYPLPATLNQILYCQLLSAGCPLRDILDQLSTASNPQLAILSQLSSASFPQSPTSLRYYLPDNLCQLHSAIIQRLSSDCHSLLAINCERSSTSYPLPDIFCSYPMPAVSSVYYPPLPVIRCQLSSANIFCKLSSASNPM